MKETHISVVKVEEVTVHSDVEGDLFGPGELNFEVIVLPNPYVFECQPVNIDNLIKELTTLKEEGSNYATLDWHEDHEELEVVGYQIGVSTEAQVAKWKLQESKKDLERKQLEIRRLEQRLAELKK